MRKHHILNDLKHFVNTILNFAQFNYYRSQWENVRGVEYIWCLLYLDSMLTKRKTGQQRPVVLSATTPMLTCSYGICESVKDKSFGIGFQHATDSWVLNWRISLCTWSNIFSYIGELSPRIWSNTFKSVGIGFRRATDSWS